jgi:hypothetical protein
MTGCVCEKEPLTPSVFEKNKECYEYKENLEKDAVGGVETVFYSPKKDSCVFVEKILGEYYFKELFTKEQFVVFNPEAENMLVNGELVPVPENIKSLSDIIKEYQ